MEQDNQQPKQEPAKVQKAFGMMAAEAGIEFAFLIAVPLLVFIYLGQRLDFRLGLRHVFSIVGIFVALAVSCLGIYRRINDYKKLMQNFSSGQKPKI